MQLKRISAIVLELGRVTEKVARLMQTDGTDTLLRKMWVGHQRAKSALASKNVAVITYEVGSRQVMERVPWLEKCER